MALTKVSIQIMTIREKHIEFNKKCLPYITENITEIVIRNINRASSRFVWALYVSTSLIHLVYYTIIMAPVKFLLHFLCLFVKKNVFRHLKKHQLCTYPKKEAIFL